MVINMMEQMELSALLREMARGAISLDIGGAAGGRSYFGGKPMRPRDFVWPVFSSASYEDEPDEVQPLAFLAQIDCAEASRYDTDRLLPKSGILSFFYDVASNRWGFDPKDKGCSRVYLFDGELVETELPEGLDEEYHFPKLDIGFASELSLPDLGDFELKHNLGGAWDIYDEERALLGWEPPLVSHKLLGWPDIIQNNMTRECELVSRGHYLGGLWETVSEDEKRETAESSLNEWILLLQLDTVSDGDFELMIGDCGRLYFYIRREDLAERRFDRVWLICQCG